MEDQLARPLEQYKQAFMKFAALKENEFLFRNDGIALAKYKNTTFAIRHYEDLLADFKSYFNADYSSIYTETSSSLWMSLYNAHPEINWEEFIIDLYSAWNLYWIGQNESTSKELNQTESRGKLSLLIETIKTDPANVVENAEDIDDYSLIPVLALALRMQFEDKEDFYRECVDTLIEEFPGDFSDAGNLDKVVIETEAIQEGFYIYQPDYDFDI